MTYDFDKVYDRRGTLSLKYDGCQRIFGSSDVIPLWVADMDFRCAPAIIEATKTVANHGIFCHDNRLTVYGFYIATSGTSMACGIAGNGILSSRRHG